jgi:hypothetical protein
MKAIEPVLGVAPGLVGAARADHNGNVLELTGNLDGESLCAVAAMVKVPLEKASELLGLGGLRDWSFAHGAGALYVHQESDSMVAVTGTPTKNPETTMKKISQALDDDFGGFRR